MEEDRGASAQQGWFSSCGIVVIEVRECTWPLLCRYCSVIVSPTLNILNILNVLNDPNVVQGRNANIMFCHWTSSKRFTSHGLYT